MGFWKVLFRLTGWKIDCRVQPVDKCVICVAPHTSNFDFILGLTAYRSMGRKANFLMKKFWFFFPLKYLLTYLGGIPVDRSKQATRTTSHKEQGPEGYKADDSRKPSLVEKVVEKFRQSDYLNLAVTPEGTRSATSKWKTGFLAIARGANVPILLAGLDYSTKTIVFDTYFTPGPAIESDLAQIKTYYSSKKSWAKYPSKFTV